MPFSLPGTSGFDRHARALFRNVWKIDNHIESGQPAVWYGSPKKDFWNPEVVAVLVRNYGPTISEERQIYEDMIEWLRERNHRVSEHTSDKNWTRYFFFRTNPAEFFEFKVRWL